MEDPWIDECAGCNSFGVEARSLVDTCMVSQTIVMGNKLIFRVACYVIARAPVNVNGSRPTPTLTQILCAPLPSRLLLTLPAPYAAVHAMRQIKAAGNVLRESDLEKGAGTMQGLCGRAAVWCKSRYAGLKDSGKQARACSHSAAAPPGCCSIARLLH